MDKFCNINTDNIDIDESFIKHFKSLLEDYKLIAGLDINKMLLIKRRFLHFTCHKLNTKHKGNLVWECSVGELEKPKKETYGFSYSGPEEEGGWMYEQGEEEYYKALSRYEKLIKTTK